MIMKKHLFFAATAALVLASCSSDSVDFTQADVLQAQDDNSVQFDTYMGKVASTRATDPYSKGPIVNGEPSNENSLKNAKFGVFAYLTDANANYDRTNVGVAPSNIEPNFMYNQEITWNSTNNYWTYDPVKYWPNGIDAANGGANPSNTAKEKEIQKLSFFAVAPFTTTPTGTYAVSTDGVKPSQITSDDLVKKNDATNGIKAMTTNAFTGNVWVKYLMPNANQNEAVDLLWGTNGKAQYKETDNTLSTSTTIGTGYNVNLTKQTVGEKVKFLFKHALAKIGGATAQTTGETKEGDPVVGGFKVVVDVDGNNGDNQGSYFPAGFNQDKTLVTIKEVKIQDGYTAGQDATVTTVENTTKSNLNTYGWFNIETGKWCNEANTYGKVGDDGALYEVVANNDAALDNAIYRLNEKILEIGAKKNGAGGDGKEIASGGTTWTSGTMPSGVGTTAVDLFANEDVPALMLIPGGSADLYVTVDYFVRTADNSLNAGFTNVEQIITNKVSLGNLDPNKYYTIIMHLGLTSVKFEAVVADWETKDDGTFDENGHYTPGGGATPNETKVWLPSNVVAYAETANVGKDATGYTFDGSALGLGKFVSGTTGTFVTAAVVNGTDSKKANLTISANDTGSERSQTITLTYELGTVTLTITQAGV